MCFNALAMSKTSAVIVNKELLLSINLGRIIKPFPKIIHKWETFKTVASLSKSGAKSANSPQSQTVQSSKEVQKLRELHLKLHRAKAAGYMTKSIIV